MSIRSRPAPQICPVLSRNRHQIDTKNPPFGAANFELASSLAACVVRDPNLPYSSIACLERQPRKSLCQLSHAAALEACPSVMDINSAASPRRLDQDLRRYVKFLVQTTNHIER
jgi:hypothetical protein